MMGFMVTNPYDGRCQSSVVKQHIRTGCHGGPGVAMVVGRLVQGERETGNDRCGRYVCVGGRPFQPIFKSRRINSGTFDFSSRPVRFFRGTSFLKMNELCTGLKGGFVISSRFG